MANNTVCLIKKPLPIEHIVLVSIGNKVLVSHFLLLQQLFLTSKRSSITSVPNWNKSYQKSQVFKLELIGITSYIFVSRIFLLNLLGPSERHWSG